jgi:acyl dehydratase
LVAGNLDVADVNEMLEDPAAHAAAMVGHHYRVDDHYEVSREKVREYARAVQDFHPAHWDEDAVHALGYDGLLAPLTFISLVGILAQQKLFDQLLHGYDLSQVMQTDQTLEFHRPIRVGDQLSCEVYLHSFRQAFGGDLLATKNVVFNQHDEVVQTTITSLIGRTGSDVDPNIAETVNRGLMHGMDLNEIPATKPGHFGEAKPVPRPRNADPARGRNARAYGSISVGDQLPERVVQLTAGDLVNYAGVSGDANPIHWSAEVAALAGLDSPVAHGMLTMGLGAGFVTSWLGDPGAVLEYNVRFTSPVFVSPEKPGEVLYTGKVKSVDEDAETAVIALVATHNGKKIFGRATATVALS